MNRLIARAFALIFLVTAGALLAQVPQLINYQGRIAIGTVNFDGSGAFKFALVNAAGTTTYWSNDGTSTTGSQPSAAVTLIVTKGLYSVLLGDTTLANMTAIPASVWANADVRLRVWFNDGANGSQLLAPDQRLAPNGYLPDGGVTNAKLASSAVTITPGIGLTGGGSVSLGGAVTLNVNSGTGANQILALNASGQLPAVSGANLISLSGGNLAAGTVPLAALSVSSVDSSKIVDGSIVNADVNASAAIAYSKLSLGGSIVNSDIATAANIAATKLGTGTVTNAQFGYLGGVTSDIQTQFSGKVSKAGDTMTGALALPANSLTVGTAQIVTTGGKVGINTTAPGTRLTVKTGATEYYGIEHTDGTRRLSTYVNYQGGWLGTVSSDPLNFFVNDGSPSMTIGVDGNVTTVGSMTVGGNVIAVGDMTCTALNITSDRNAKEGFKPVNTRDVLDKVARLPISEWQYKTQTDARHIGPMAQDFHDAFAVGRDEKHIATVDADGVALAAIQGLNQKLEDQVRDKETRIHQLEKSVEELKEIVGRLVDDKKGAAE